MNCPGCAEELKYFQKNNNPILFCPWCKFKVTIEQTGRVKTREEFLRKAHSWISRNKKRLIPFDF